LSALTPTNLPTGTYVSTNVDGTVQIDFGQGPVTCPSATLFTPLPGDQVRCIKAGATTLMIGPAVPRSSIGTVTAVPGAPLVTVLTSIGSKQLPYNSAYAPTIGDTVIIDWAAGGIVTGKVTGIPTGSYTPPPATAKSFSADFRANDSGTWYVPGSTWNQTDVWCTSTGNNRGAWFYGNTIADTIPNTAKIGSVQVFVDEFYNIAPSSLALIGLHTLTSKSGAPTITSPVSISAGTGWKTLPNSFGDSLKSGSKRGIGTGSSAGSGFHKFTSRARDSDSGKLRIKWTV
jgi:hypothetical protein